MLINELHFEFNLRLDRVASQDRPDLYDNEIDAYLNRGIKEITKNLYDSLNANKRGFETDQERINRLMSLHIKYPVQPALTPTYLGEGLYEVQLDSLTYQLLFLTGGKIIIEKDGCTKQADIKQWQIDDRKNTFNEPNFDWNRVHANFGRSTNSTDDGSNNNDLSSIQFDTTDEFGEQQFTINSVRLSYLKVPNRVCLGTYKHIDDTSASALTPVTNCDLPNGFFDEILEQAVFFAHKDIQDQFGYQSSAQIVEKQK